MTKGTHGDNAVKLIWNSTDPKSKLQFYVFVDPATYQKWQSDKSIPMVEVVQSFQVFEVPTGGNTGLAETPSKLTLDTHFGSNDLNVVIKKILDEGSLHATNATLTSDKHGEAGNRKAPINASHGSVGGRGLSNNSTVHG